MRSRDTQIPPQTTLSASLTPIPGETGLCDLGRGLHLSGLQLGIKWKEWLSVVQFSFSSKSIKSSPSPHTWFISRALKIRTNKKKMDSDHLSSNPRRSGFILLFKTIQILHNLSDQCCHWLLWFKLCIVAIWGKFRLGPVWDHWLRTISPQSEKDKGLSRQDLLLMH